MVTWLQSYLDISENRATWAYVADALIAQNIPNKYANLEEHSKINIFLQTWKTQTSKLPKDLKNMIEVAKKFGTRLEGLAFLKNITREMPVWYHAEAPETSKSYNQQQNKCLRENHNVRTVGNMEHEAKKIHTIRHSRRRNCRCTECATARTLNCKSPYKCFSRANEIMKTLPPKWNPTVGPQNEDRMDQNQALGEGIKFDYRITTEGTLADAFRIFTEGKTTNELINQNHYQEKEETITIYTDGLCINNGNDNAKAGAGIFCPTHNNLNRAIRIPQSSPQTNQSGEILSIKEAVKTAQPTANL
ncbi:hypothetical protein DFH05DRAFT_1407723, partial [Lentinula detonsa]